MGDRSPSTLHAGLSDAIGQLLDVRQDLASWADREGASSERVEPLMKAIDGAVGELRVVRSLLLRLEQLPEVRPVGGKFPSLEALADHARHSDAAIPDGTLVRLQQVIFVARAAGVAPSVTRGS